LIVYFLGLIAVVAAFAYLRRRWAARPKARVTDDVIRQIESRGEVEMEESLDMEEIEAEERRFWDEETWDESEEC
jgi:hypothetical protein